MAVFIIEDDPGVCDSLQFLLQSMGHVVFVFPTAEAFLRAQAPDSSDTVIVDLGLPGVGGADLIRHLNAIGDPPKVICISGQAQKVIEESLRGIETPYLLRKPLSGESLIALL